MKLLTVILLLTITIFIYNLYVIHLIKTTSYEQFGVIQFYETNSDYQKRLKQYLNMKEDPILSQHIFISIASYRDDLCFSTLNNIFSMASDPSRIYVGICQQNDTSDVDCMLENHTFAKHVRIVRLTSKEAQGPTYARYICSKLWQGEEYYLQIDAHMTFVKNWDRILIKTYKATNDSKAVLTYYPRSVSQTHIEDSKVPRMCSSKWDKNGMIQIYARLTNAPKVPQISPYSAAGFMFANSMFLFEVPYDPYLPFLFQGEEILFSARLWTSGWNFYQPTSNIVTHYYLSDTENKNVFWKEHTKWYKDAKLSIIRAKLILEILNEIPSELPDFFIKEIDDYGLGNERSIDDYFHFAKIDIKTQSSEAFC